MLPSTAVIHLLGINQSQTETQSFSWYTKFTKIQKSATFLAKKVPCFRSELLKTLCYLIEIHEYLTTILSKWNHPSNSTERKHVVIRKVCFYFLQSNFSVLLIFCCF